MKSTSIATIVFAILLTIWVHVTVSQLSPPNCFDKFLKRLERDIEANPDILLFTDATNVIGKWKKISDEFQQLCFSYAAESMQKDENQSLILSLNRAIHHFFYSYKLSAVEHKIILDEIESVDPLGFIVYLTENNASYLSPEFVKSIVDFRKTIQVPTKFEQFLKRLEKVIKASSQNILPFMVKHSVIERLKETSAEFQELCTGFEAESLWKTNEYAPVRSLHRTINLIFFEHKQSHRAKESKRILNEIEVVDPIGLNVYLTKQNVNILSPTFIESVEEFRRICYEKEPLANSEYFINDFLAFIQRFKKIIADPSSTNVLPFMLKIRIIMNLWSTSNEFKVLCCGYEAKIKRKNGKFSPASSLIQTIHRIFYRYKKSPKSPRKLLSEIELVDPIDFNVYLTKENVRTSSPNFVQTVEKFHTTMESRVRLFKSEKDDAFIEISKENHLKKLHEIPETIRNEITSEYKPLSHETIDFFIEIAMEQLPDIKMYPAATYHFVEKFKPHSPINASDVQILYSGEVGAEEPGHALCIYYHGPSQHILVYDSTFKLTLEPTELDILRRLYPFCKGFAFMEPKTLQGKTLTCAVYAITYATALLLGEDPAQIEFRSNDVYGEDALYMRLHLLNMFANRELVLMK